MDRLRRTVLVWPPQNQSMSKLELTKLLDLAAANRTSSARPKTRPLKEGEVFKDAMVLKRTHSDMGQHVLLPGDPRREWDYLLSNTEVPGCHWFAQSYVETLAILGEWRVFIVGSQIVYVVHTVRNPTKKTWSWDVVTTYYSIRELRYVTRTSARKYPNF
jgi:hypothetical protein